MEQRYPHYVLYIFSVSTPTIHLSNQRPHWAHSQWGNQGVVLKHSLKTSTFHWQLNQLCFPQISCSSRQTGLTGNNSASTMGGTIHPFCPNMCSNWIGQCKWSVSSWSELVGCRSESPISSGWHIVISFGSSDDSNRTKLTSVNNASVHWSLGLPDAVSPPSLAVDKVVENSVTRRARGFVLFRSSIAETLAPPLEDLLPFFWSRAMKFSLRELDLWLLPKVRFRMSLPLVLCFTGDTKLWRLPKESDGSLRPRTFRLDLIKQKRRL